ncbi:hypothetical protein KGF54_000174 [Candida jiufengensis]|uniref:uncharacterized protein n=1 Tax=Candida jiufengensis TaxID=497108 RepID=UPI0022240D69|nr:uncharacterized protein KGF54_000174 [Candida jiufengensis]KAI5957246.1 hypothetical protein KGF54_000174 [Candida jiufengensis]
MNNESDIKVEELLNLLNEYQQLTNTYRSSFINGFLHLSRANFQSEKIKFGKDTLDLRNYKACKNVDTSDGVLKLVDNLIPIESIKTDKEKKSTIKNRKTKKSIIDEKTTEKITEEPTELEFRDPILQFGALTPKELKLSQKDFNEGLQLSVRLINLRNKINKLIDEIESMS